jgi:hypothetical protein
MEGRDFVVVPMIILTEGVHNGSEGPIYYPPAELSKTPATWNHKPIVVYHPQLNGVGISACDPDVITRQKIGVMMNTRWDKNRLRSEAWIDKDRADMVDERIMEAVHSNTMLELSTGVFIDQEDSEGEWNGEDYVGIARNLRPDHLAILPDKTGACSISDGAGFLRNAKQPTAKEQKARVKASEVWNAMSFSNTGSALSKALHTKLGENVAAWIQDIYPDFFIYERDGKLYRLGYSATDTDVSLNDEDPQEVVRVTEYRTTEGAYVGNQGPSNNTNQNHMDKKKLVDAILLAAAALGTWTEADREQLMAMNEKQLELIQNRVGKVQEPKKEDKKADDPPPATNQDKKQQDPPPPAAAATPKAEEKKAVTMEEYVAAAPEPIRQVLNHGIETYNAERAKLIQIILSNKSHTFTEKDLTNRPLGELKNLAALASSGQPDENAASAPNFKGQGNVPPTGNTEDEPLAIPAMNFEAAK